MFAVFGLGLTQIVGMMLSSFNTLPDKEFLNKIITVHEIWVAYLPALFFLGLGYIIFGLVFNKLKSNKFRINLILGAISLIWVAAYSITCVKSIDVVMAGFPDKKYVLWGFAGFGFLCVFVLLTGPQCFIGWRIRKQEHG